ncbi:DNA topoisomerase 3 [Phocaeicola coprophilus]|jgi:DNA topoisomerase-3|uniref:DNA topoisomerase n=1 Tax=Phocaeicola coprophilus DSM 18228 = JCM 13818 TaxID=547042 RepID=S0F959_9BACT|nr:DNA topoisomerase 3 [Phocaeicola coprophilus]EEF76914.1 DNA topoisomerase [Phocaeicola coprophilus DSM 18228 = JCM 13818]QRO24768.1 DNA topoisomerase 3 [Phocaeicola coprophilus]
MIVCIAEKPSVAHDIAEVLGAKVRKEGYFEGNGYQVTWTFGHLCTLKEPHEYTPSWKSWSLGSLPMIPPRFGIKLIDDPGIEKQFHIIERLMGQAEMIINCGDAGQEGELIQRWVMQKAGAKCPVKRLWISSLTEEAIREGFAHLKDQQEFQPLYEAGLSRAIGDWTLGMNATRLYTLKYGQNKQVLSIGRVQTPTLALIVNRQKEIENFVPKQYWELKTLYRDTLFSAIVRKSDEELAEEAAQEKENPAARKKAAPKEDANRGIPPITDRKTGEELLQRIQNAPFTITDITAKKGTEAPPRLFDLTSLQVECNKKFSYSADMTLQLIQSLYEKKVATYPRVDTTFLSDDIYPKCPKILEGIKDYARFTAPLAGKQLLKSKKVFDNSKVTDHHAIIPTGVQPQGLTDMEKRVFDLIARRFIAVFYPDCKFSTTTVTGEADSIEFKVSGKQILDPGWRVIFAKDTEEESKEGEEESVLPAFSKGESGPHQPQLNEKWTQPPRPYTEATLLRAMETAGKLVDNDELRDALKENGIGRPSTRAAIIETLFKRHYIRKERKNLIATPTGVELIQLIREELLKSAELTGIWEKKLREIERRNYDAATFLSELKQMVTDIVYTVLRDNSNRRVTVMPEEPKTPAAKPAAREKKTEKKTTTRKKKDAPSPAPANSLPEGDAIVGQPCPLCGKGTILKGKTAYGCSEWKNGCTFRKPFDPAPESQA